MPKGRVRTEWFRRGNKAPNFMRRCWMISVDLPNAFCKKRNFFTNI